MGLDSPQAPASAYFEMVEILGESYFTERVPLVGTELRVRGVDGVDTVWAMTDAHGRLVAEKVRAHSKLALVSHRRYANVESV